MKSAVKKKSVHCGKNVITKEKISDQKLLAKYYSLADVFVICSKRENFPTTCVEAQCCGTAVAGFDTGGTKETAVNGVDSFVKYGDIEKLREKVEKLLYDQSDTKIIAPTALKQYSKQAMYKEYEQLYCSFMNGE